MVIPVGLISRIANKFVNAPGSDRTKSIILSTLLFIGLLILMFFIRFWPPSDAELAQLIGGGGGGGVTVNFGDTDFGSGANFQSEKLDVKNVAQPTPTPSTPEEDIISQDDNADKTDAVIPKHDTPKKEVKPTVKPVVKPKVETPKPIVRKPDDALASILHGSTKGGDGNTKSSGNQGRADGNINSNGYSGSGGSGGGTGGGHGSGNGSGSGAGSGSGSGGGNGSGSGNGSGYSLGGRKALSKPKPENNCGNEDGVVVVKITVDKNGNVITANPGYKGTTNSDGCLMAAAKKAAIGTKWEASPDGTETQVGTIIYNFKIQN